jgi:peptide-methionine (S)-S-oxide reductase
MKMATAILAGGCFWCIEAIYNSLRGVSLVESGYIGGHIDHPTYEQICNGDTGHAEAIRVAFDPAIISYDDMLDIFFEIHDPTQLNRQGNDVGTQYRSAIFVENESQRLSAQLAISRHESQFTQPIVTEVADAPVFYVAEAYHQDYFVREGAGNNYCAYVVAPKVVKFRKSNADKLKN